MTATLLVLAPLRLEQLALAGHDRVRVLHTGMGPARARRGAAAARDADAAAVAVAGFCAAIAPELRAGDVVCANELLADGAEPRAVPGSGLLAAALRRRGLHVHVGALASCDRLEGPRARRRRTGEALALDMESAWLAEGAAGRPLAVVRVVVDEDGRRLTDPRTVLAGLRALRSLRRSGGALAEWAAGVATAGDRAVAAAGGGRAEPGSAALAGGTARGSAHS